MSKCTNKDIGNLLHGYEIGILSEQDGEQFELHLLECEHCHKLLKDMEQPVSLLKTSKRVKALIDETSAEEAGTEHILNKIWKYIWPDTPVIFKPAIAYIVILLLILPVYRGLNQASGPHIRKVQSLNLLPGRSTEGDILVLRAGYDGLIKFVYEEFVQGKNYQVVIKSENNEVVFQDNHFSLFNEFGAGFLLWSADKMKPGDYRLIITDPGAEPSINTREYNFKIVKSPAP